MNDLFCPNRNDAIDRKRLDSPTFHREIEKQPRHRTHVRRRRGGRLVALGGSLLLAGGLTLGGWGNYSLKQEVMATARQQRDFVPSLHVATVEANPATVSAILPGTTAAFAAANIFARATGYIAKRNVDIGDRVKAGDLLAALAVPELDHQISQNEATLDQLKSALQQARANRDLAQVTWDRDSPLVQKGWVTPQQGEAWIGENSSGDCAIIPRRRVTIEEEKRKRCCINSQLSPRVRPARGKPLALVAGRSANTPPLRQ
jgi:hypothetical protein